MWKWYLAPHILNLTISWKQWSGSCLGHFTPKERAGRAAEPVWMLTEKRKVLLSPYIVRIAEACGNVWKKC
jgi:hypothetical protein